MKLFYTSLALFLLLQTPALQPRAAAEPVALGIDPVKSTIVAVTSRAGLFSFVGHEHAILANRWIGTIHLDPSDLKGSSARFLIPVAALEIDSPEARKTAGLDAGPSPKDTDSLQETMLGPSVLDAKSYPQISFRSVSVETHDKKILLVKGILTLHGVSKEVSSEITMAPAENDTYRFSGVIPFKLSDFEIKPPSPNLFVKVGDDVKLIFEIYTKPQTGFAFGEKPTEPNSRS